MALAHHADRNAAVLAIGPGGVYVATQLAVALHAKLDVLIVRDIMVGERSVGVLTEGGVPILDPQIDPFALTEIQKSIAREMLAIEQARYRFRGNQPFPSLDGTTAILVDDAIESPQAMIAALHLVKRRGAAEVVIATPAATQYALDALSAIADEVVCLARPVDVTAAYSNVESLRESDVLLHLQRARLATSLRHS